MENTITPLELSEICEMPLSSMLLYLNNFRFSKYRVTERTSKYARFKLNDYFLNDFYSYLFYKNRTKNFEKLGSYFKDSKLKVMSWEDFVCKS